MRTFSMRSEARSNITPKQKRFLDAAARGHNRIVKALLEAGVDVNVRDGRVCPTNRTALMHAAENGHLRVAELLIQAGAEVNAIDKGFPVDCPGGNTALLVTLHKVAEMVFTDGTAGNTAPLMALRKRHITIAHRLLNAGASPKTRGGGTSVINCAARAGDVGLFKRLIELGADPRQADGSGFTPLAAAVQGGRLNIIKLLLDSGVDPNSKTPANSPVLIDAAHGGDPQLCQLLLARGADPNLADSSGFTALMMACVTAHKQAVEKLVTAGARLNDRDDRGRTAVDILVHAQRPPDFAPEVLQRLTKSGQNFGPSPERYREIEKMLRKLGAKASEELLRN
jgi:ankyrin repeat protein